MRATERKGGNATEYQRQSKIKQENEYINIIKEGIRAGSFTTRTANRTQQNNTKKKVKDRTGQRNKTDETKSALEKPVETGLKSGSSTLRIPIVNIKHKKSQTKDQKLETEQKIEPNTTAQQKS